MTGVRFLFRVTLRRLDLAAEIYHLREPQKIPKVLSPDETRRLLAVASSLKARVMLSLSYGCGLRVGEVVRLKVKHIDSAQRTSLPLDLPPRFRALVLFGRRPHQRVDSLVMPATENLHTSAVSTPLQPRPSLLRSRPKWCAATNIEEGQSRRFALRKIPSISALAEL